MTPEEQLIERYFDAFNRHDIEGVMACFHEEPVLVGPTGKRCAGRADVRRSYESEFAMFPDAYCDLRLCTGKQRPWRGGVAVPWNPCTAWKSRSDRCGSNGNRGWQNQGDPRLSSARADQRSLAAIETGYRSRDGMGASGRTSGRRAAN